MSKPSWAQCMVAAQEAKNRANNDGSMLVYLAAPYTHPDSVTNTRKAIQKANELMELHPNWLIFIPHLTLLWDMLSPRPHSFWYHYTMVIMTRCDMVYRMIGESHGADAEVELAKDMGIPVIIEEQR